MASFNCRILSSIFLSSLLQYSKSPLAKEETVPYPCERLSKLPAQLLAILALNTVAYAPLRPEELPLALFAKEIILLDVARTSFTENKEENREKIANILKAISKESPNITYCQGMNYIASFLLMITNDEEETFYASYFNEAAS